MKDIITRAEAYARESTTVSITLDTIVNQKQVIRELLELAKEQDDMLKGMALENIDANMELMKLKAREWQPIEDCRPEDFQEYLIGRFGGENIETIKQCTCIQGDWIVIGMFLKFVNPTHFMLLPLPPKPIKEAR